MKNTRTKSAPREARRGERGAALITTLLVSFLMLSAGGILLLTTAFSVSNAFEPTAEMQAYYAAEAGIQSTLNVLRGNVAPAVTYRKAVTPAESNYSGDTSASARLSNWLNYSTSYPTRVTLVPEANYSNYTGTAFSTVVTDPDNSASVSFTTTGSFTGNPSLTLTFGNSGSGGGSSANQSSITYTPPSAVSGLNTYQSASTPHASSTFGSLTVKNGTTQIPNNLNQEFVLTITQSLPWQASAQIKAALTNPSAGVTLTFPSQYFDLDGVQYKLTGTSLTFPGSGSGTVTPISISVYAPEPRRVQVNVTGYGPRSAVKRMQMMVSRFVLDYYPRATIAIRGADDQSLMTFNPGNSAQYMYSGNANSGPSISGFAVTNTPDYNLIANMYSTGQITPGQVTGSPPVQQVAIASLPPWLQTADAARTLLNRMQKIADFQHRLFTTGSPPSDFGTSADPKLTFVDGDADLPTSGGAGLLIVTGTLSMRGSTSFDGLILVLGRGQLLRDGGGNGNTLGAVAIARFDRNTTGGPFLPPTFISNGSGTSTVRYDPPAVRRALGLGGRNVLGVSEY